MHNLKIKSKEDFIKENFDIFDNVGLFPEEYEIQLKHNAEPKIMPYHRLPLLVKDRLIGKLKTLIKQGIVSYVNKK